MAQPQLSSQLLSDLIHHIFLPPKLPQNGDESRTQNELELLKLLQHGLEHFATVLTGREARSIANATKAIKRWRCIVGSDGSVLEKSLLAAFRELCKQGMCLCCVFGSDRCADQAYQMTP